MTALLLLALLAPAPRAAAQTAPPPPGVYDGDSRREPLETELSVTPSPYPAPIERGPATVKAVAITLDDGPSLYTQAALDVLAKHHVRATFFMVGEMVAAHPDFARKVLAAGHEIGNHTYHHLNFCAEETPEKLKQLDAEIVTSAAAIEKAVGKKPALLRMPYGCHRAWLDREAQRLGYDRPVLWDVDGEDWKKPGVAALVTRYVSQAKPGSILLMHDGGGDRTQTVAALDQVLTGLEQKGLGTLTAGEMLALTKTAETVAGVSAVLP